MIIAAVVFLIDFWLGHMMYTFTYLGPRQSLLDCSAPLYIVVRGLAALARAA